MLTALSDSIKKEQKRRNKLTSEHELKAAELKGKLHALHERFEEAAASGDDLRADLAAAEAEDLRRCEESATKQREIDGKSEEVAKLKADIAKERELIEQIHKQAE
jgi:seryl-tRNA synthetase